VECENIATLARCDAVRRGHPLHQSDPAKMAPDSRLVLLRLTTT
jgi:hypothetical protein